MTDSIPARFEALRRYLLVLVVFLPVVFVAGLPVAPPAWGQEAGDRSLADWRQALKQVDLDARRAAAVGTRACDSETQQQLLPLMIELLRDETDGQVRLAILDTVSDMGPAAELAVSALVHSMKREFRGNSTEKRHQDYRAALALSRIGEAAVEPLCRLLSDESSSLRSEAAMALGRMGPAASRAVPELIALFDDEKPQVRSDAVAAVRMIGPEALARLLDATRSNGANVRASAIESLAIVGLNARQTHQVADVAIKVTSELDPDVRMAALKTISSLRLPDEIVVPQLRKSMSDESDRVRVVVVNALTRRPELVSLMIDQLSRLVSHPDDGIAWHAAFLLHKQGIEALEIYENALVNGKARVETIARACALLGRSAVPRLTQLLNDEVPRLRRMAALALGDIRPLSQETIVGLTEILVDKNQDVKLAALVAIRNLGARSQAAVPSVRALVGDESAEVKIMVAEILEQAAPRDQQLIDDLVSMLNDRSSRVRRHAIDTLRTLGPESRAAIPSVVALLKESVIDVRSAAARFLASQGAAAEEAVPVLVSQMRATTDVDWLVTVIETLGDLGAAAHAAAEPLGEHMSDSRAAVRLASLKALMNLQLEPEQVHAFLVRAFSDFDEDVRSQSLRSIRRFGRRGVIFLPDLILLSAKEDSGESLARALERLDDYESDPATIRRLLQLTTHEEAQVRRLAAKSLGRASAADDDVRQKLDDLSDDPDAGVRNAAADSLQRILDLGP